MNPSRKSSNNLKSNWAGHKTPSQLNCLRKNTEIEMNLKRNEPTEDVDDSDSDIITSVSKRT